MSQILFPILRNSDSADLQVGPQAPGKEDSRGLRRAGRCRAVGVCTEAAPRGSSPGWRAPGALAVLALGLCASTGMWELNGKCFFCPFQSPSKISSLASGVLEFLKHFMLM